VTTTALWDSLRTASMHMQRPDLATFCDQQDLEGAFYFFIFSWLVGGAVDCMLILRMWQDFGGAF
jgi:hypothetical protein